MGGGGDEKEEKLQGVSRHGVSLSGGRSGGVFATPAYCTGRLELLRNRLLGKNGNSRISCWLEGQPPDAHNTNLAETLTEVDRGGLERHHDFPTHRQL